MPRAIVCPACGESEELTGAAGPDGIEISCDRCGHRWPRDAVPVPCATCGGADLEYRPQPTTAYSRGTQVSILGWRQLPLCAVCDAEMLSRSLAGKPVPNTYEPAALHRRKPGDAAQVRNTIIPR